MALKLLPFAAALEPKQLKRFRNEAMAAASLHHEHIIPVYAGTVRSLAGAGRQCRSSPRVALAVTVSYRVGTQIASAVTLNLGKGGLGIRTMLLGTPDHLFMMFAVGQVSELGDSTMNGMFAIHDGTVWAPVELTLVGSPFMKAWETGSKGYYEWLGKGVEVTDLNLSWGRYKPATLPVTDWRASVARRADVDKRYGNEIAKINKLRLKHAGNRYFAQVSQNANDGNAYLQLGIIYGEAGELDEARRFLEKAEALLPGNAEVINNLANVYYLKGDYPAARVAYEKAARQDPADPYILVNLALCYLKLDNREKATEAFTLATQKDATLIKKHRSIAIELLGSM